MIVPVLTTQQHERLMVLLEDPEAPQILPALSPDWPLRAMAVANVGVKAMVAELKRDPGKRMTTSEMAPRLGMTKATLMSDIANHFKPLKKAGLRPAFDRRYRGSAGSEYWVSPEVADILDQAE